MQECNPPRNSWLQTHQDDGPQRGARKGFALVNKRPPHRIDRFAHALENSKRSFAAPARGVSPGIALRRFRHGQQSGFTALLQPVTLAADVDRSGVVQQAVEDRRRDDRVAEDRSPIAVALVGSQNDAASFVARADQLEEDRGASRPWVSEPR